MEDLMTELIETLQDANDQRCDFTGWNKTEALVAIALELKRYNDAKGH